MAKKVIFLLLEVFKDILPALHICHIKATHREASKCTAVAYTLTRGVTVILFDYSPLA